MWLRQREVVHFARFKELFDYYKKKLNKTEENTMISNNYIVNQLMGEYPYK